MTPHNYLSAGTQSDIGSVKDIGDVQDVEEGDIDWMVGSRVVEGEIIRISCVAYIGISCVAYIGCPTCQVKIDPIDKIIGQC